MRNQENTGWRSGIERSEFSSSSQIEQEIERGSNAKDCGKKNTTSVWPNVIVAESDPQAYETYEACDSIAIKLRKNYAEGMPIRLALVINSIRELNTSN